MFFVTFCRITIGLLFLYSFLTKIHNVDQFAQTISNLKFLPPKLSKKIAFSVLIGELGVVGMALVGSRFLPIAFVFASLLLTGFSLVLAWVLLRHIQTSCNCFGTSKNNITIYDLFRNIGFLACTVIGGIVSNTNYIQPLSILEYTFISLFALIFLGLMTNLQPIALTLKSLQKLS